MIELKLAPTATIDDLKRAGIAGRVKYKHEKRPKLACLGTSVMPTGRNRERRLEWLKRGGGSYV